jgi:formylglycine-generating enzyme
MPFFWEQTMCRRCEIILGALSVMFVVASVRADVFLMPNGQTSLDMVTVGDPGNTGAGGLGSVSTSFRMGKYEVTIGQYCQFLNSVAKTSDPYGLYGSYMPGTMPTVGIARSGSVGNYSYAVSGSYNKAANCPIFDVSWGDAARFCNWLHNGQPTFAAGTPGEVAGSTESGAYTLNGTTSDAGLAAVTRNAGAQYFIPSQNEWYKAAYYKGGGTNAGYWQFPTRSDGTQSNALSTTGTTNANFYASSLADPTNLLTPVGLFAGSPGPYGTYDQGGNVWEWNETANGGYRYFRGGSYSGGYPPQNSSLCMSTGPTGVSSTPPTSEDTIMGFRVAGAVPEPGSLAMLAGVAVTALVCWRRRRA